MARHFLQRAALRYDKNILGISEEAVAAMTKYEWPGNVREVENAVERAVIHSKGTLIESGDLTLAEGEATHSTGFMAKDMSIEELKVEYAKHLKSKYPAKTLKDIKEILKIDWNTLRKYLAS